MPTATPTATPPLPTHYDLPAWLHDPEATVLMAQTSPDMSWKVKHFTFVNVSSGDRFDLPAPSDTTDPYWGRDEHGLYFEYGRYFYVGHLGSVGLYDRVHIATGDIQHLDSDYYGTGHIFMSPDGSHLARVTEMGAAYDNSIASVTLEEPSPKTAIELRDPLAGKYTDHANAYWSPTNRFVAAIRLNYPHEWLAPAQGSVTVYSLGGEILQYYDEVTSADWAPDGSLRILFQQGEEFGNYVPCVLDLETQSRECIGAIPAWRQSRGVETAYYQWALGVRGISFIYWADNTARSGLCVYELDTEISFCPLEREALPSPLTYFDIHGWSSDGSYLWFVADGPYTGPGSDDKSYAQIFVAHSDGTNLTGLGYGYSFVSWRPPINFP